MTVATSKLRLRNQRLRFERNRNRRIPRPNFDPSHNTPVVSVRITFAAVASDFLVRLA